MPGNSGTEEPEVKIVSIKDFLAAEVSAEQVYQLTGTVSNIKNTQYGNFDLTDGTGTVYVYGLSSTEQVSGNNADQTFSSLNISDGDKLTIKGYRADYQGTAQVGSAWFVDVVHVPVITEVTADVAEDGSVTFKAKYTNLSNVNITKAGFKYEGQASGEKSATASDGTFEAKVEGLAYGTYTVTAFINEDIKKTTNFTIKDPNAESEEVVYTLSTSSTENKGSNSAYDKNCDITVDGITWNVTGNAQMNPWRLGGKSTNCSSTDRTIYSKNTINHNVSKIEIEHGSSSSITVNSMTVIVATDSEFTEVVDTIEPEFKADGIVTVNRSNGKDWTNCYYKFVYNLTATSSSSNGYIQFNKVEFTGK